jgi:hypothetical protein
MNKAAVSSSNNESSEKEFVSELINTDLDRVREIHRNNKGTLKSQVLRGSLIQGNQLQVDPFTAGNKRVISKSMR